MAADSFPSFEETQSSALFHLEEADRKLSARYPWWSHRNGPTAPQRRAMRRAARKVRAARRILASAPESLPAVAPARNPPASH